MARALVPWTDLPEHCLTLVFKQLAPAELGVARLVCVQWAQAALVARSQVHVREPLTAAMAAFLRGRLMHMKSLELEECRSVHHLHSMVQLTSVHIDSRAVPDFEPMAGLSSLASLSIEKCICGDLEPLSGLTKLSALELYRCDVSSLLPLSTLTNLCTAKLHGNRAITDITPLAGLVRLTRLQLSQSGVTQVKALGSLTGLECLFLDRSPLVPDLSPLVHLTNLAHLSFSTAHRAEVDVGPLAALSRMHCLDLIDCKLANLAALSALTSLRRLGMRKSRAADMSSLALLSRLTSVDLRRSNFSDAGVLTQLRELRLLVMDETDSPVSLACLSAAGAPPITVLRDDAGYLGCSFKHSNLKHMCDRHAHRANSGSGNLQHLPGAPDLE